MPKQNCPTCGTLCEVEGNVTQNFVSNEGDDSLRRENERLRDACGNKPENEKDTLRRERLPNEDEIENKIFNIILNNKEYHALPDYYVRKICVKVIQELFKEPLERSAE